MKRKIITTGDGSKTIQIEDWNEQYHSIHGALQEALHVFIKTGLHYFLSERSELPIKNISVLEIGFGTGLNALLTAIEADKLKHCINYVGIEAYPVSDEELNQLNYNKVISESSETLFDAIYKADWDTKSQISSHFNLLKRKQFFKDIEDENTYDLIYFDAFGARVQPELWTKDIFKIMHKALNQKGVLVTYAAIGQVRRDMKSLGFKVERLKGPPGKRHMLRATKL